MKCPLKYGLYDFEGGEDCIGSECGMHKLCGANDTLVAENDVSAASVDANDVNAMQDSRKKLEADVHEFVYSEELWNEGVPDDEHEQFIMHSLDRQAAITNSECRSEFDALDEHAQALERENAELKAKLDQTTVERDILQDCVDDLNADTSELQAKVNELTEDYKASSNGLEILTFKNAELQTQVNNLNSENAKLSSDELHLRNALASAEYDNATLREKLGRVLDMVQEMERVGTLVDQEGNVIG